MLLPGFSASPGRSRTYRFNHDSLDPYHTLEAIMFTGQDSIAVLNPLAITSGTAPFLLPQSSNRPILIVIEDVSMVGDWVLDANPPPAQHRSGLRPNVAASLQRSLDEHAEVWAELSKL